VKVILYIVSALVVSIPALSCVDGEIKTAKVGTKLACDKSLPDFEVAYKAPNGLIWAMILDNAGKPATMNFSSAVEECRRRGARVPKSSDWYKFWQTLGFWSAYSECSSNRFCYAPVFRENGKEIFPEIQSGDHEFWSTYMFGKDTTHTFGGRSGNYGGHVVDVSSNWVAVICVADSVL
jgi:hypothetical protein